MKLFGVKDPEKLFEAVGRCRGKVELVSDEGDVFNLKSTLTKYLSLAKLFSSETELKKLELRCSDPEDAKILLNFMANGNV